MVAYKGNVPDLVRKRAVEGTREKKMGTHHATRNPGGPFGGECTLSISWAHSDGKQFAPSRLLETKWMDWGKDNYAAVALEHVIAPDSCCIGMDGSNWQYANNVPTTPVSEVPMPCYVVI